MGENDVQGLKDDIGKVESKVDTVMDAITELRVLVAGKYVPREDFSKCQAQSEERIVALHKKVDDHKEEVGQEFKGLRKEIRDDQNRRIALAVSIAGVIFTIISIAIKVVIK